MEIGGLLWLISAIISYTFVTIQVGAVCVFLIYFVYAVVRDMYRAVVAWRLREEMREKLAVDMGSRIGVHSDVGVRTSARRTRKHG